MMDELKNRPKAQKNGKEAQIRAYNADSKKNKGLCALGADVIISPQTRAGERLCLRCVSGKK